MIADMISNKKLNTIVTELFNRSKKLNTALVFTEQSYFAVPNTSQMLDKIKHFFITKIQTNKNLDNLELIICLILILKIS